MLQIGTVFVLCSALLVVVNGNENEAIDSKCSSTSNCFDCMQVHPQCQWCTYDNFTFDETHGRRYRCGTRETLIKRGCPETDMENTVSEILKPAEEQSEQQLRPATQKLSLRPGEEIVLNLTFYQMKDYPVDIYYLTDISYSMKDDLETISQLAVNISDEMRQLTKELRLGFGSFVDKPLFPYVVNRENPCIGTAVQCDPPRLYQHYLALTPDIDLFKRYTKTANASGNVDFPEGGLDALMQVAMCDKIVGWSNRSRKIVLFTTDGSFHVAGDGRLAGLISPPPTQCVVRDDVDKFDAGRRYTGYHDAIYHDYPSIGELERTLRENRINVIFGVIGQYTPLYRRLAEQLPVAKVGEISANSQNIVELIKDNYRSIVSEYTLVKTFDHNLFAVDILTRCHNEKEFSNKSICFKHPLGQSIDYQVRIRAKKCFETGTTKPVVLSMQGLTETSNTEVSTSCNCCAGKGEGVPNSSKCNYLGTFKCGACECPPGRSGEFCECSYAATGTFDQECTNPNVTTLSERLPCSNRGVCVCGKCKCNQPQYSGKYCECDSNTCLEANDNNQICGGSARGTCNCDGSCTCKKGYSGVKCDCLTDNSACFEKDVMCSGQGQCDCGMCICYHNFRGPRCEYTVDNPSPGLCDNKQLLECVFCMYRNSQHANVSMMCVNECNVTDATVKPRIVDRNTGQTSDVINCLVPDDQGCLITFFYYYTKVALIKRAIELDVMRTNICQTKVNILHIVLGVLAGVVIIGLVIILVWKLVVTIDDQREMARFTREQENAKWEMEENPIFKEPVTKVTNPMYMGD